MPSLPDYIGNAAEFPVLNSCIFLNHAGVCPLPKVAADALRAYAAQAESAAYLGATWYYDIERLRQESAALINAHRDEIAFVKNTSEGLSIVAKGIEWQWGDRIVTTNVEYPANVYPWMDLVQTRAVKLAMVEEVDDNGTRRVPTEKILEAASHPRTRLVSLSHVQFASGQRMDIETIGRFCRERNILFCVDAIQTLGVLPVDVRAMNIDYLSADGHKWLLGPEGAGIFFCRRELLEHTRPLMLGWLNVVDAMNYGAYDFTLKPDAGRFECGTYNVPGLLSLRASINLLAPLHRPQSPAPSPLSPSPGTPGEGRGEGSVLRPSDDPSAPSPARAAGVSPATSSLSPLSSRIKHLTDYLSNGLSAKGYHILSPRANDEWSGSVAFTSPTHNHAQLVSILRKDHHIEIALRESRLRASPHFYNTEAQLDQLLAVLP